MKTITGVNMEQINKAFTKEVANQIAQGKTIYTQVMGGSQSGVQASVVFKDDPRGKFLTVVYLEKGFNCDECVNTIRLVVGGVAARTDAWFGGDSNTVWLGKSAEKDTRTWYKVADNWYVENLETVKQIKEKRKTRFDNRTTRYVRKFTVPAEVAKKYVKKVKGFKTIHTKDIQKAYTKFENLRTVDKGLGVMVTEYDYQLFVVTAKKMVSIPMGRNGLPGGWNLVH